MIAVVTLMLMIQPVIAVASKKATGAQKPLFKVSKEKKNKSAKESKSKNLKDSRTKSAKESKSKNLKDTRTKSAKESSSQFLKANKAKYYNKGTQPKYAKGNKPKIAGHSRKNQDIVELRLNEEADKLLGIPYCAGGASLRGTDCSGLTRQIYSRLFGIEMPHNSTSQNRLPFLTDVPVDDLQPGDLIFWGPGKKRINHVGIYIADGKFIHASRRFGVTISSLSEPYWQGRFMGSKRVKSLASYTDGIRTASRDEDTAYETRQVLKLGYNSPVLGDTMDLSLGAFMEFNRGEKEASWKYAGLNPSFGSYDMGFRKGAWVSTDARIFDWLAITPTLGYVDGRSSLYEKDGTRQILGLGARMAPHNSRWSLMMSAAYSTQPDESLQWNTLSHSDWKTLDMSLGFSYSFSNLLKLSVTGTRAGGKDLLDRQDDLNKALKLDDVLFRFDLGF